MLKTEYIDLVKSIKLQPKQGTPLGNHCYKIRLSIASKGKGRSGGARVITYVHVLQTSVYLLSIFDKSEQDNISDKELISLIQGIG